MQKMPTAAWATKWEKKISIPFLSFFFSFLFYFFIFFYLGRQAGAEEVATRRTRPRVNPWRALHVGFWNIWSLSDDDGLLYLSNEFRSLRVDIAALSEERRLGSGETSVGGSSPKGCSG